MAAAQQSDKVARRLSTREGRVARELWTTALTVGQLSERLGLAPSTISGTLEHLEELGHAERLGNGRWTLCPLGWLWITEALAAAIVTERGRQVAEARRRGASWERIGSALGVSRQTAHERWSSSS